MKQLQFTFKKESELEAEIRKIRQWYKSNFCSTLLIQVYNGPHVKTSNEELMVNYRS